VLTVVVMGVSGSGKSTVGRLVAEALRVPFLDGDDFHDDASIVRMRRGEPLDDATRGPWLDRLHSALVERRHDGAVVACSALTTAYRRVIGHGLDVRFVLLDVPRDVLARRLRERRGHFAGPDLLASQLEPRPPGPGGGAAPGARPPAEVAAAVVDAVRR
jgi:gluconokinase